MNNLSTSFYLLIYYLTAVELFLPPEVFLPPISTWKQCWLSFIHCSLSFYYPFPLCFVLQEVTLWTKSMGCFALWLSLAAAAIAAKSRQSCPTLCDPIDDSPAGSSVPGILQARILEWVAISFSNAWKWKVKVKSLSLVWLLATPWTAAYQSPLSMGFSRQEDCSGLPLSSPRLSLGFS